MKIDILGVKVNTETKEQILDLIRNKLDEEESVFIVTPYSESIVAAQKDAEFRNILNSADFAIPDGAGVMWAAKLLTSPQPSPISERVPGREFIWDLARLAESRGESIFLLGGFGDTPLLVAENLKSRVPNLKIAGIHAGSPGEEGIVEKINSSGADFLFIAFGPIRQEKWIAQNLQKLRIKLVMGVGGTFDYIAGKRPLPPQFLTLNGLEWLWRLLTQPWRVWRVSKGVLGLIWYTLRTRIIN